LGCAKRIVQAGISAVYYSQKYQLDGMTEKLFKEANVKLYQISIDGEFIKENLDTLEIDKMHV
jgi:deoxycytidylate deaminase